MWRRIFAAKHECVGYVVAVAELPGLLAGLAADWSTSGKRVDQRSGAYRGQQNLDQGDRG